MNKKYLILLIFFISYLWFHSFGRSILPVHVLSQGLSVNEQIFSMILLFISQGIIFFCFRKYNSRLAWYLGIIFVFLFVLLSIRIFTDWQFYLAAIISGAGVALFWLPYNIAHYKNTKVGDIGESSAVMFSILPMVGILAPLAAGILLEINQMLVWVLVTVFFLLTLFLVRKQENFNISYSVKHSLQMIRPVRDFIFLQGVWEVLVLCVIPIYTLHFIQTPGYYGTFLALLSTTGLIANLIIGRVTDKIHKRAIFLYPLTIGLALSTFTFSYATQNLFYWTISAGLIQLLVPLFWNITLSMVIDLNHNPHITIPGRELMLLSGRILGSILVFVSFILEKTPFYIFILLGLVMIIYPVILFWNTKISKKYKYL